MTINIPHNGKKSILPALNKAGKEIFSLDEIIGLTGLRRNYAHKVVAQLEQAGRLIRLERGKYLYVPEGFERNWTGNSLIIASRLVNPYAISYWTALNHWHYTEQIPSTVFIQTTHRKFCSEKEILGVKYRFVTIGKGKFFGLTYIWINQHKVRITDREKTIIDCMDHPEYSGGIIEPVKGVVQGFKNRELDIRKLLDYTGKAGNKTVFKRLGYMMETLKIGIKPDLLEKFKKNAGKGYTLLDPTLNVIGKLNRRWQLKINISKESLTEWQGH